MAYFSFNTLYSCLLMSPHQKPRSKLRRIVPVGHSALCRTRRGGGAITMFSSAQPSTRTGVLHVSSPYAASLAAPFGGLITREYNVFTVFAVFTVFTVSSAHKWHPLHKAPHPLGQTIARDTASQSMTLRAHTTAGSFGILNTLV